MHNTLRFPLLAALTLAPLFWASLAVTQTKNYVSRIDAGLTVKSVVIVPLIDNVNGIYANPLTQELDTLLSTDRQWNLAKAPDLKAENPDVLEENQKRVLEIQKKYKVDALIGGRIFKTPKGVTIKLALIGGDEGLPMTSETIENFDGFETSDLKLQLAKAYAALKNKLPYQATVTSRQGQLVTVNVGKNHGAKVGEDLLVVLITKAERHPKFKFITSSEREILGKVRLSKVDDSISFGSVTTELTANLIQPGFKIARDQFLNYPGVATNGGKVLTSLDQRTDQQVAFGDNPTEWKPIQRGSFGKMGFLLGFTQTALETATVNGNSAVSENSFAPSVKIDGEIWIDPNWQVSIELEQLAAKVNNGYEGSVPSTPDPLNFQMQRTVGLGAYNFLANDEFFGPKFHLMAGFGKISLFIDDSAPRAHTSKDYSALVFGLGGSLPFVLEDGKRISVGGRFLYHISPTLAESPVSSGSSADMVSDFLVYGEYGFSERLSLRADLEFKQISSSFSGGTANSSSANFIGILAGVGYQF